MEQVQAELQAALDSTGIAEGYRNGLTVVVREDEDVETYEDIYVLCYKDGEMPPHFFRHFQTLEEMASYLQAEFGNGIFDTFMAIEPE